MGLGQCSYCGDIHHDSEDCGIRVAERSKDREIARLTADLQAKDADSVLDKAELSRIRPKRGDPYFHSTVEEWAAECRQTADLRAELAEARKLCGEAEPVVRAWVKWRQACGGDPDELVSLVDRIQQTQKGHENGRSNPS